MHCPETDKIGRIYKSYCLRLEKQSGTPLRSFERVPSPITPLRSIIPQGSGKTAEDIINAHYDDVIKSAMASQIPGVSMVCSTVCSSADYRKHQSSASLAFMRGIHRSPMNSPHKRPVKRKMFPFDYVIMIQYLPRSIPLPWATPREPDWSWTG